MGIRCVRRSEVSEGTEVNLLGIVGKCNKFSFIIFGRFSLLGTEKSSSVAGDSCTAPARPPVGHDGHR